MIPGWSASRAFAAWGALLLLGALSYAHPALARPQALLGPQGATWFGPLPPRPGSTEADRGAVVVDPDTGALWVEVNDLVISKAGQPLRLARVWDGQGWGWAGQAQLVFEARGVTLQRPGEAPASFPSVWTNPLEQVCYHGLEVRDDEDRLLRCTEEGYTVFLSPQVVEYYDHEGRLIQRSEDGRPVLAMDWSDDGLASLADGSGTGHISIDPARVVGNRKQRVARDQAGHEVVYETDDQGKLVLVRGGVGPDHRYLYDEDGRLRVLMWNDGSRIVVHRDESDRVRSIEGPGRQRWRFEWSAEGLVRAWDGQSRAWHVDRKDDGVTVRDPSGLAATLMLQDGRCTGWRDPVGHVTRLHRNAEGALERIRDAAGGGWSFRYDEEGLLVSLADAKGAKWQLLREAARGLRITDPTGRRRTLRFDDEGRVVQILEGSVRTGFHRDAAGRVREIVHGTRGRTRIERDGSGRIQAIVDGAGGRTRLEGWRGGGPSEITDPEGGVWKILFDSVARASGVASPDGTLVDWTRDQGGRLTLFERDQARTRLDRRGDGTLTRLIDPLGGATGWTRDAVGRITSWRRPDGSQLRFTRDGRGDLRSVEDGERRLQVQRDPVGRPVALVEQKELGGDKSTLLTWTRDLVGRVVEVTWPQGILELGRDPAGKVRTVRLGEREWSLELDASGRLRSVREDDERWDLSRDDSGRVSRYRAPWGELELGLDPRGLPASASVFGLQLHWRRDAAGRTVRIDGPANISLGIQRDMAGLGALERLPGGALLRHERKPRRVALTLEDSGGRATHEWGYALDALDRVSTAWDDGTTRRYRYGPHGELSSIEEGEGAWSVFPGRREGPPGTLELTTDPKGRPVQAAIDMRAPSWGIARTQLDYELDRHHTLEALAGDSGHATLEHDALGRLVAVTILTPDESEEVASWRVRWDPFGRPELIDAPPGETSLLAFLDGHLLGLQERGQAALLLADGHHATVMASEAGHVTLLAGVGNSREVALYADGEPYVAASTPGGLRDLGFPGPLTSEGRFQLFPGGPLLGPTDALDPLSGLPTSVPWMVLDSREPGWPSPSARVAWPRLDGASEVPWDPAIWDTEGPWAHPLQLLVELGELDVPVASPWWLPTSPAAPLPWMPASLAGHEPSILPPSGAWPLDEDPIASLYLASTAGPAHGVTLDDLLAVLLAEDAKELPRPLPAADLPTTIHSTH